MQAIAGRFCRDGQAQHGDRGLHLAVRLRQGALDGRRLGAGGLLHQSRGAVTEFRIRRLHIDHQVAVDLAEPNHQRRAECVEDKLLGSASFHARRAGNGLRPGVDDDHDVDVLEDPRARHAGQTDRRRAALTSPFERSQHPGRTTARGDPKRDVQGRQVVGGGCASDGIVFGTFDGTEEGIRATRETRQVALGGRAKGRHSRPRRTPPGRHAASVRASDQPPALRQATPGARPGPRADLRH